MNGVLDSIEHELAAAVRRRNARARRRRTVVGAAVAALIAVLAAGGAIAAVSGLPAPIKRLLGGGFAGFAQRPGSPRLDLRLVDPGGLAWTTTTYIAKNGLVSGTAAPDGLRARLPAVGGASGFVIADNLLNGPLAGLGLDVVRARGHLHYFFSGTVDAQARKVVVELGQERRQAVLSSESITVPVHRPARSLTAEGIRRAARMPRTVSLRSYAVAFTPDLLAGKVVVRATVRTTVANGTTRTQRSGPLCVGRRCGIRIVEVQ